MFDKWKKKIKDIFTEEVIVEVEEEVEIKPQQHFHVSEKQNVQTKVMYQYPERNSFRFPVIPDKPDTKAKQDIPAYQKRDRGARQQQKPAERQYDQAYLDRQTNRMKRRTSDHSEMPSDHHNLYQEAISNNRKVYKKNPDIPFQPTDVPSPIYGYQKRHKQDDVTDIPAYKRKELKQQDDGIKKQSQDKKEPAYVSDLHRVKKDISIQTEEKDQNENLEKTHEANDAARNESAATIADKGNQVNQVSTSTVERNGIVGSRKVNPINSSENKKVLENKERPLKSEPYNVIMTPRDKKNLYERRNREQSRKESQPVSDVQSSGYVTKDESTESFISTDQISEVQATDTQQAINIEQVEQIHAPYHLLNDPVEKNSDDQRWINEQQQLLEQTLKYFNVRAKVVKATQGPSVTRFEVHPELGVKVSKIKNLSDDLKLNMAARDIRIEAPIPGKNTVGIEVPNPNAEMVGLQAIFETEEFKESKSPLSIALGLTIEGAPKITNIQKMPHGLIAGATGSGKSVCINTILISLIYKASHEDVKFLLIDPKMVELAPYNGIPHLVAPVITDVKAATQSLKWAVNEMEERYEKFVEEGVRDIERYNQKVMKQGRVHDKMPFIVIVIDELADLMMMSPQDVEDSISRIAQKARACGIHLLLATQRPSVDVITGLIKANIPTRIAFSVSSQIDSRTIIDSSGAEKLLGRGDMLFIENGAGKSVRLQGPFVSDEEIERITSYARSIAEPNYLFEQEELLEQISMDEDEDELMEEAIQFIINQNSASTSLLQRHFKIGYNRAARLIDSLEAKGVISGQNGSKPRDVLITTSQLEED